jgi:hypothetical protein
MQLLKQFEYHNIFIVVSLLGQQFELESEFGNQRHGIILLDKQQIKNAFVREVLLLSSPSPV